MSTRISQKIYKCKSKSKMKLLGKRKTELEYKPECILEREDRGGDNILVSLTPASVKWETMLIFYLYSPI